MEMLIAAEREAVSSLHSTPGWGDRGDEEAFQGVPLPASCPTGDEGSVTTKEAASVPAAEPGPPPLEQQPPGFAAGKLLVGGPRRRVPAVQDRGDDGAETYRPRSAVKGADCLAIFQLLIASGKPEVL
jgi:hypothetical protein